MSTPWSQAMAQVGGAVAAGAGAAAGNIAAGARSIAAGAHNISTAASAGKLSVDPQTGQSMIDAINKMLDDVRNMQRQVRALAETPRLGNSPDAVQMADHSTQVAKGGQSAQDALNGLHQALLDLQDGIDRSMKNYGQTDQSGARTLNQTRH